MAENSDALAQCIARLLEFVQAGNVTESNKVVSDGKSYTGTFDAHFYDTSGNQFMEVTATAERRVQ